MSFREWLSQFRRGDNAIGDLARDVAVDRCFPRLVKGRDRLERYERHLTTVHNATPEAVETLRKAWAAYEEVQGQRQGAGSFQVEGRA